MTGSYLLPTWLSENAETLRARAARARRSTVDPTGYWGKQVTALAETHEAAAQVYEAMLVKILTEQSVPPSITPEDPR